MCVSFLNTPHWAWAVEMLGPGVFIFTTPHKLTLAFVSAPSFWVAAATVTGWKGPFVLNLTTGDLIVFSPLLTPRFGCLFSSFLWVARRQARHSVGLSSQGEPLPLCVFPRWVNTQKCWLLCIVT